VRGHLLTRVSAVLAFGYRPQAARSARHRTYTGFEMTHVRCLPYAGSSASTR
jgi:hypothetical protein